MSLDRRHFLHGAAAAVAAGTLLSANLPAQNAPADKPRPNRIGVSTYSFWRFRDDSKVTVETCIDQAAEMGFDAVEILRMQMEEDESAGRLHNLKRRAFSHGISLCGLSTHQTIVSPDAAVRKKTLRSPYTACNWPMRWASPPCASTRAAGGPARTLTS